MPKDTRAIDGAKGSAATKKLRSLLAPEIFVEVTEPLIQGAIRGNSGWCMVSAAVKKAAPWATHISSDLQTIRVTDPNKGLRYVYLTPRRAQNALIEFDQGKKPEPFQFKLGSGSTHTSYKRKTPGERATARIHTLGRRKIVLNSSGNQRLVPSTIGGAMPPRVSETSMGAVPKAPMGTYRREFGMRAYVGGFAEGVPEKMPVGAPSLSDK